MIAFLLLAAVLAIAIRSLWVRRQALSRVDGTSDCAVDEKYRQAATVEPAPSTRRSTVESRTTPPADIGHYKRLYHRLQSLDNDILPEAYIELCTLLSETIKDAQASGRGILTLGGYDRKKLEDFLHNEHHNATDAWEAYLRRRRAGGAREMFSDRAEAEWWLRNAAPVKYVDGSWLGHIAKTATPFHLREISKHGWQVMSEELGDGDLKKNHVYVYEDLMRQIGADMPHAYDPEFVEDASLDQLRCWKAAVAQLLVSLFPNDFLPEALGFNMAYEGLPLHLMKTTKELKELKLDPYYFVLHISIDNADSGHAAMAMEAAMQYIEKQPLAERESAWRRVQAGFVLADQLPTTPESPSLAEDTFAQVEQKVIDIFAAKAPYAHKIHCSSRVRIGKHSLIDWLEPKAFASEQRQRDFLHALSECRPWVVKGDSVASKLSKELGWEGKMYGAFTEQEVMDVRKWIDMMSAEHRSDNLFFDYTGAKRIDVEHRDLLTSSPYVPTAAEVQWAQAQLRIEPEASDAAVMLLASAALLEQYVTVPARVSDEFGSGVVRALRAQLGFDEEREGVAGMGEMLRPVLGLVELAQILDGHKHATYAASLARRLTDPVRAMLVLSKAPWAHRIELTAMAAVCAKWHLSLAESGLPQRGGKEHHLLTIDHCLALERIAKREHDALAVCTDTLRAEPDFAARYQTATAWMTNALKFA